MRTSLLAVLLFCTIGLPFAQAEELPSYLGDPERLGKHIQRTMTLLDSSTAQQRNTVRVLFYGQSITEQAWWKEVAEDLKQRFPHANLIIENRALGGFASQRLVKTAETDLYPFQPDLLIFHVYGAHNTYEEIIKRTRERTTAEILIQTDHIGAKQDWQNEPTDPAKITPKKWSSFMNYKHLPKVIQRYGCGYVDQRNLWKRHLREADLKPQDLLRDGVHLNDAGCKVMAAFVKAALVKREELTIDPMNCGYVKTYQVGKEIQPRDGMLELEFEGARVDLIAKAASDAGVSIVIDGKQPSEHPELYQFTRALAKPGGKWPVVANLSSDKPLLLEQWTMEVRRDPSQEALYHFKLRGSKTGPDGEGRSDQRFVSDSGRVIIDPADWDVAYALRLARVTPVPEKFTVSWQVVPRFVDGWQPQPVEAGIENTETIASGLEDRQHTLQIQGDVSNIQAVRVYSPKKFPIK